ncbi:Phosphoribosylaminoimidazole carboxamideformyltransferase [Desulfobacca acetoxidans DSM 11109]|uniref:Phosphoribosylaminoimidazole carboxamideformyltransferase n=1 Tax=Desulfobacca acetoxidans (strain ATCC 700848 / DSM 11109 / ASRB2) TaxID=880072 RepID=F2NHS3_DESAR|nr:IMP cyclohydrolase [Desulfobacca acetoxidans]AEB09408.1 Phosphoribosylaminoimidazole carboxamideformyltransferase [Desulfobacca acetoxidans DSM 11109]HAY20823.1 IMP cyclohydrolase [Desulfobacterales bacterium]
MTPISRAIMSVTDKSGLVEFAKELTAFPIEVLSTGGTAKVLRQAGLAVREVSDFTGFPEMLDGRVKTLHPKIHGGILGRRDLPDHVAQMQAHQILPIDLVVVNLYQFEQAVAKPGCTLAEAIENIDIGGPAMLRSSAKNFQDVTVVVDPADYSLIIQEMKANQGATTLSTRFMLARKVFALTNAYDRAIYNYLMKATIG